MTHSTSACSANAKSLARIVGFGAEGLRAAYCARTVGLKRKAPLEMVRHRKPRTLAVGKSAVVPEVVRREILRRTCG